MDTDLSTRRQQSVYRRFHQALRYCILLGLTGLSFRELSLRVADSHLFHWFTYSDSIGSVRPLSKSAIERFEKHFSDEEIAQLIHELGRAVATKEGAEKLLYQETALRFDELFADTTCVKANIHFPVDWVLFRDSTRTLIQAIMLIRSHGLRHRIRDPKYFITAMNKLCIEMTNARKKKDSQTVRKQVLRKMKRLMKLIESHAKTYHQVLGTSWKQTDWSEIGAQVVLELKGYAKSMEFLRATLQTVDLTALRMRLLWRSWRSYMGFVPVLSGSLKKGLQMKPFAICKKDGEQPRHE